MHRLWVEVVTDLAFVDSHLGNFQVCGGLVDANFGVEIISVEDIHFLKLIKAVGGAEQYLLALGEFSAAKGEVGCVLNLRKQVPLKGPVEVRDVYFGGSQHRLGTLL